MAFEVPRLGSQPLVHRSCSRDLEERLGDLRMDTPCNLDERVRALPFLQPANECDRERSIVSATCRAERLDVDRVRDQMELVPAHVERLAALRHVERRHSRDRIRASDRPPSDGLVVQLLLKEEGRRDPAVRDPVTLVRGPVHVQDERPAADSGRDRRLVRSGIDVGVGVDHFCVAPHEGRQQVGHRVHAERHPECTTGVDGDIPVFQDDSVFGGRPGSIELDVMASPFQLECEVRRVDDGAAGPGRQEGANLSNSHPIPPRRGCSEKWPPHRRSWSPRHSRLSHDSEPVSGLSYSV